MMKKTLTTTERLEQALNELEAGKKETADRTAESAHELEVLAKLQAKLEGLPYDERRKVLNAAGLKHISAAPKPIAPLTGRGAVTPTPQATVKKPNWKEWKHTPEVRAWQACALSLDIDPHSMIPLSDAWMAGPGTGPLFEDKSFPNKDAREEYELRMRLLVANLSNREYFSPGILSMDTPGNNGVRLAEFAYWAIIIMEWDIVPDEMVSLVPEPITQEGDDPFIKPPPPPAPEMPEGICPMAIASQLAKLIDTELTAAELSEYITNDSFINWNYWVLKMPVLTASQAARLMAGLDPDVFESLDSRPNRNNPAPLCSRAKSMERSAVAQQIASQSPVKWLEWADAHPFLVHDAFRAAVLAIDANHLPEETAGANNGKTYEAASGVDRNRIIAAFPPPRGVTPEQWSKRLGDPSKKMKAARVFSGSKGGVSALWNPAQFAMWYAEENHSTRQNLTIIIRREFPDYLPEWETYTDIFN